MCVCVCACMCMHSWVCVCLSGWVHICYYVYAYVCIRGDRIKCNRASLDHVQTTSSAYKNYRNCTVTILAQGRSEWFSGLAISFIPGLLTWRVAQRARNRLADRKLDWAALALGGMAAFAHPPRKKGGPCPPERVLPNSA